MKLKLADEKHKIIEPWYFKFSFNISLDQYLEQDYKMVKRNIVNLYKNHPSMKYYVCFYCSDYADSKDHVPAASYACVFEDQERILVRSCISCNSILSNKPFHTIQSRCEYLLEYLSKKYRKLLQSPHWTKIEIEDLNGSLKSKIIIMMKNKTYIEKRITYLKSNIELLIGNIRIDDYE